MNKNLIPFLIFVAVSAFGLLQGRSPEKKKDTNTVSAENRQPASTPATKNAAAPKPPPPPVAPAPAAGKTHPLSALDSASIEKIKAEYHRTANCYETQACDYPQTDPRSYDFAVGRDLQAQLQRLKVWLMDHPEAAPELADLIRESMKNPDGHVQEAALSLMEELPPSPENLNAVLDGLHNNPADPLIFDQASKELGRYIGSPQEAQVHDLFEQTMRNGAHYTAEQAGTTVRGFLTHDSTVRYRRLLSELPEGSATARNLGSSLDEHERRLSGG